MKRLQLQEGISHFHPFMKSVPEYGYASGDVDLNKESGLSRRDHPSGNVLPGSCTAEEFAAARNSGNDQEAASSFILNQNFTQLVEDVSRHLPGQKESANEKAALDNVVNKRSSLSDGLRRQSNDNRSTSANLDSTSSASINSESHHSENHRSVSNHPENKLSKNKYSRNSNSTASALHKPTGLSASCHPLFQQLEALVNHFDGARVKQQTMPSKQANFSSGPAATSLTTNQHLADLTAVLSKKSAGMRQVVAPNESQRSANQASPLQTQQKPERATPSRQPTSDPTQQGRAEVNEKNRNSNNNNSPMPDLVKRNVNLEIEEQSLAKSAGAATQSEWLSFASVSPMATQRLADALNDYLQHQADLHGVDLS